MKAAKKLVVEYDVTDLTKEEIGELELEAVAQGEESDGQGGKHYGGKTGHPGASVLGSKITKRGKRSALIIEYDVTNLTKDQTGWLASEAEVQSRTIGRSPRRRRNIEGRREQKVPMMGTAIPVSRAPRGPRGRDCDAPGTPIPWHCHQALTATFGRHAARNNGKAC